MKQITLTTSSALMFTMMICGWVEGSIGPLLPSLQVFYGVSDLALASAAHAAPQQNYEKSELPFYTRSKESE